MRSWIFLILAICECTPRVARAPRTIDMHPVSKNLIVHVDRNFQGDRSMWLEEAAWRLESDTRGKLRVEYHYDLDFSGRIQRFDMGEWYLVDLSEASPITAHFDAKHGTHVLGECDPEFHVLYLVTERVTTHDRFVHTAMHETLHAVGLPHVVGDTNAIMTAIVVPRLPLHMSPTDLDAFCGLVQCPTKEVRP